MAPNQNNDWLNKTPNKTVRGAGQPIKFIVYHETASPNPTNSAGTLNYNMSAKIQSSYNYLIGRDGTLYNYVDPSKYISWHAGVGSNALGYSGWYVNVHSIGIEYDGRNNGEPITEAQRVTGAWLTNLLCSRHGISFDMKYHLAHSTVAPGYKSDPRGFQIASIVEAAKALNNAAPPPPPIKSEVSDIQVIGLPQAITVERAVDAMKKRGAPMSEVEMARVYSMATWLEIDVRFFIAVAVHESGRPMGGSVLQKLSNCPINMRAASGEWRPKVQHPERKDWWLKFESYQLGSFASLLHMKNVHGPAGRFTVRQIIPVHAPANDGNAPESFISAVIKDMLIM